MFRFKSTVALSLLALGCANAEFTHEDEVAVRALSVEYGRAWLSNDSAAVMRVFADRAVLVPHLGNPHELGKRAIRDHFWPPNTPPAPVIQFDRNTDEVRGSRNLAWERGRYALAFVYQGDTLRNAGNYVAISERQPDKSWRWVSYTWNHR